MSNHTDSILEDILKELEKQGGIAARTAEDFRSQQPRQQSPGALEGFQQAAEQAGQLAQNSSSAADALPVMAGGVKSLGLKILPGFGTAIELASTAAKMFYEYMNDSLNTYKDLNTSGIQTTDGMLGLNSALAEGRITADEFKVAIADTKDVIASLGADGTRDFGKMLDAVIRTESEMGALNMSYEQMGKYVASNLKMQKAYGIFDRLNEEEKQAANRQYMDDLNKYSKALGISTDELADKMNKSTDSVTGLGTQLALVGRGMDDEQAAKTAQTLNMVLGSFGSFGDDMNNEFARFLEFGQLDLDSTFGQLYQTNDEIRGIFDNMRNMALDGSLATEEGAATMRDLLSRDGFVASMDQSLGQIRAAFGDQAANQLIAMRNQLNNYNAEVAEVDQFWNNVINDFNNTISEMFFGFKQGVADLFIDPNKFIIDLFGEKWGNWLLGTDAKSAFGWVDDIPALISLKDFLSAFFEPAKWLWDAMMGYGEGVSARFAAIEQPSWQKILRALVPDWLADIILDENGELSGATDILHKATDGLVSGIDKATDGFAEWAGNAGGEFADHMSVVSDSISSAFSGVSDWFNAEATQTVIDKSVITQMSKMEPVEIKQAMENETIDKLAKAVEAFDASNDNKEVVEKLESLIETMSTVAENTYKQVVETKKSNKGSSQIN